MTPPPESALFASDEVAPTPSRLPSYLYSAPLILFMLFQLFVIALSFKDFRWHLEGRNLVWLLLAVVYSWVLGRLRIDKYTDDNFLDFAIFSIYRAVIWYVGVVSILLLLIIVSFWIIQIALGVKPGNFEFLPSKIFYAFTLKALFESVIYSMLVSTFVRWCFKRQWYAT